MNVALLAQVDSGYKFEPETLKWITNIKGNGGTISGKSLIANDILVKQLKGYGLRSLIQYLITYSGNNLAAGQCPIIYDIGTSVAANTNFVEGDFTEVGGLGDATNTTKRLSTGFTDAQLGSANSYSGTTVFESQVTSTANINPWGTSGSSNTQVFRMLHVSTDPAGRLYSVLGGTTTASTSSQTAKSVVTFSRTSTTSLKPYINGVAGTEVTTATTSTPAGVAFPIFTFNTNGSFGTYDQSKHLVDCFGYGLNATQAANLATCLNNFKTRIGR